MKKIYILLLGIVIPIMTVAQNDWANYARYAEANTQVYKSPKAVLMGDSITDGWPVYRTCKGWRPSYKRRLRHHERTSAEGLEVEVVF